MARTSTGELHAVQCKLYAEDYRLQKSDIDSFFTASGKKSFSHRIIVSTTNDWSIHAEEALRDQQPPVTKIDLHDLEVSQIDWRRYQPKKEPKLKPRKTPRPHQVSAVKAVKAGLKTADRGKLIMACGTGKTFTTLKIAEEMAGPNGHVLFLVPNLSLLSQTLTEWTQESKARSSIHRSFIRRSLGEGGQASIEQRQTLPLHPWKALSKQGLVDVPVGDTQGMQRAVAFCQVIDPKPVSTRYAVRASRWSNLRSKPAVMPGRSPRTVSIRPTRCVSRNLQRNEMKQVEGT